MGKQITITNTPKMTILIKSKQKTKNEKPTNKYKHYIRKNRQTQKHKQTQQQKQMYIYFSCLRFLGLKKCNNERQTKINKLN